MIFSRNKDYISVTMENRHKQLLELNDVTSKLIKSILTKEQLKYLYKYNSHNIYWYNTPITKGDQHIYIGINNSLTIVMRACIPGQCHEYESDGFCGHLLSTEEICRELNENTKSIISIIKNIGILLEEIFEENVNDSYNANRISEEHQKFKKFMDCIKS